MAVDARLIRIWRTPKQRWFCPSAATCCRSSTVLACIRGEHQGNLCPALGDVGLVVLTNTGLLGWR
jgi:hypothetical protein